MFRCSVQHLAVCVPMDKAQEEAQRGGGGGVEADLLFIYFFKVAGEFRLNVRCKSVS